MIRIKICGITNEEDAAAAVELGADALGFVMAPSPRRIEPARARAIIERLPPFVTTVGVLVAEPAESAVAKLGESGCRVAQLHGDWPREARAALRGWPIIRALKVRTADDLAGWEGDDAGALLLDAYRDGLEGGTGEAFDWTLARAADLGGRPIILAGGLTPDNVAEAVATVRPYAVDVSTGVEREPGRKDRDKMKRFMDAARAAGAGLSPAADTDDPLGDARHLTGDRSHAAR
jgi:phosphoribosylanthranilate isomerase